jgi:hypothetical protein
MPAIRKPVDTSCLGSVVSGGAPIRAVNVVDLHPFFHGFIAQQGPTAVQTLAPILKFTRTQLDLEISTVCLPRASALPYRERRLRYVAAFRQFSGKQSA